MKKIFVHTPLVADVESLLTRHGLYRCRVHSWNERSSLIVFDDDEEYVIFALKGLKEVIELDTLKKFVCRVHKHYSAKQETKYIGTIMAFSIYSFMVIFVVVFFFLFPIVSILVSPKYTGLNKIKAFVIVLLTSWVGRIWLWCQEK